MSWRDFDVTAALTDEWCELLGAGLPRAMLHRLGRHRRHAIRGHATLQARAGAGAGRSRKSEEAAGHGDGAWSAAIYPARAPAGS